jgi:alpha-amylase
MTRIFISLFFLLVFVFSANAQNSFPAWLKQSNFYEINIRQYSKDGDFNGVINQLPRLKSMGVEVLVLLPVTPIGLEGRRMNETELGSFDAVRNYFEINPEFGKLSDFKKLVQSAQQQGLKVIIDWVAGYTARDHEWTNYHPSFYEKQTNGDFVPLSNRTDVIKLNYAEDEMRDSMVATMKWWIKQTDINGFRCIEADGIPIDFWARCLASLNQEKKELIFIAEGEGLSLHEAGFHVTCGWSISQEMKKVAKGSLSVTQWEEWLLEQQKDLPGSHLQYVFTSNNHLNSSEGTEMELFGNAAPILAIFTQTYPRCIPMMYNGQEIPLRQRLSPFTRDSIQWIGSSMSDFYKKLHRLRRTSPALSTDASYKSIKLKNPEMPVWAYLREMNGEKVLVLLNFNEREQRIQLRDEKAFGNAVEVFSDSKATLTADAEIEIPAWGYRVYQFPTKARNKSSK